jgi:hypothetical protein
MRQLWQHDGGDGHPPSSTIAAVIDMGAASYSSTREHEQPGGADQHCVGGSRVAIAESSSKHL